MRAGNINHAFLDGVLSGAHPDVYYHLGIASTDPVVQRLRDVRAVVMAGSGERIAQLAGTWSAMRGGSPIVALPKEDRFVTRYSAGVLFVSHGMGMPSASIAVQELMRLVHFVKRGDPAAMDEVFWARVGTSGGVGVPGGAVVVTTEGVLADLRPYRVLNGAHGEHWFDGSFPAGVVEGIIAASAGTGLQVVPGRTVATHEFFLEQHRLDGAVRIHTAEQKMAWLRWIHEDGVRNIEMEGAMLAGYLNHWGFPRFAMVCCTLLDRLEGDQVLATAQQLHGFSQDAGRVLFAYLDEALG